MCLFFSLGGGVKSLENMSVQVVLLNLFHESTFRHGRRQVTLLPSFAPISRYGNITQRDCSIFLFFLYFSEVLDFNLKIHTHFASRCIICPCWNDQYFEFLPHSSINAGKIARFILWLWHPVVKLLSSPGVSMSRFEYNLGACTLGKCCSLALDTQHFSTRYLEVREPSAPEHCKSCSLMWTPSSGNCHSLPYPVMMEDPLSSQKWNRANFFKWIFFPHVLSTLIIPFALKKKSWLIVHFTFFLLSFSCSLFFIFFLCFYFLPSLSLKIPISPVFFRDSISMQLRMPGGERG